MADCDKYSCCRRVFYVASVDWGFMSHRLPLALHGIENGDEVFLLAADTGRREELEHLGIHCLHIPFVRGKGTVLQEMKCLFLLYKYFKMYKPDIIHNVNLKITLLGSLAARLSGNYHVVNAINGLGYCFTDGRDGFLQRLIRLLIRTVLKSKKFSFILQNPDDMQMIRNLKLANDANLYLIKGSGVDLDEYHYVKPARKEQLKILFPSRILLDKGIIELIEAAKSIREAVKGKTVFVLAGSCDNDNPAVLKEEKLRLLLEPGYIEWIGYQKEMFPIYADCGIVVLPSYREGLPKALIEACAVGRPIVTTNAVGCRECVVEGYNGYLVPIKDSVLLADALRKLILDFEKRELFGWNSRKMAERDFSIQLVIKETFYIYDKYPKRNI